MKEECNLSRFIRNRFDHPGGDWWARQLSSCVSKRGASSGAADEGDTIDVVVLHS